MSKETDQAPIGIDLGTTYSVVAYIDSTGRPTTVPNGAGDLLTPSAIAFEDGQVIVGKEAVKGSVLTPEAYADCFKRDMGRERFRRSVGGREVPPEILSAFLLRRLKEDAERRLGPIRRVVITVPAFFDETRRKATQEAGRLAGLDVLDIINEPTAAAIAFGYYRGSRRGASSPATDQERVLVYDLGGGTFDVTILEINGPRLRTLSTDGDVQLGGKDFDERLVNYIAQQFVEAHGVDPRSDPRDAAQLWLDAQDAKHALSERRKTTVVCFHAGVRLRLEITRDQFEEMNRDLLARTESTTALVVKQAGLVWSQINRVLLVGGGTRMPMVVDMLRRLSGLEPDASQSADEIVAHGAALYAALLTAGAGDLPQFELVNVNSHSLGVVGRDPQTRQKVNVVLIPKNTPLPCRKSKRFRTARRDQRSVKVSVLEGESQRPEYCIALGECVVRDLPPGLPAGAPVEVEYAYAANGTLSVRARIPAVRQSAAVTIDRARGPELGDLDTWRERLCGLGASRERGERSEVLQDRGVLVRELDELYLTVAAAMLETRPLPLALGQSRRLAERALEERREAESRVARLEALRGRAGSPSDAARLSADVAQAEQAIHDAKVRARFALLSLGRECLEGGLTPPEMTAAADRIRQIQGRLASG